MMTSILTLLASSTEAFSKSKFVMATKFRIKIDQITDLHMHTREIQVAQFFSDKDGN
jgi:hypothetical protein